MRRHHAVQAPTALEVLKAAIQEHGEITDEDRRAAAAASGLPEAAVYGVSTFYDDLLAPRGARHVRVCTGTACFAATGDAHVEELERRVRRGAGQRSDDGAVSLAETVCLGFCHSSPAIRDGELIDAGPDAIVRVLGGADPSLRASRSGRSVLEEPGADAPERLVRACATRSPSTRPSSCSKRSSGEASAAAAAPASRPVTKWAFARASRRRAEVHRRQRRRGRPGLLHRQVPDGAQPRAACSRAWRSRATRSAPTTASS